MKYLVISDIHSNWEALEAVLQDAAGQYDEILCCGDLIGYGADPNAVVEWARANVKAVVRGNHDKASVGLEGLEWFNPVAKAAAMWTKKELVQGNAQFVRTLPKGPVTIDGFQIIHGSPLDEDDYLVDSSEAADQFPYLTTPLVFFGHTHLQGGFVWNRTRVETIEKPPPDQTQLLVELDPECAYLINPGSVGQPRDGDARAGYVLYDTEERTIRYHRLTYDLAAAQEKIRRAGLPPHLADRLAAGR